MNTKTTMSLVLGLISIASMSLRADPMPMGFTYQGSLIVGTNAANGHYDFRCAIYDAVTNGNQVGPVVTNTATAVANGYFDIWWGPDYSSAFQGEARWLEMAVRTNGGGGFVTLTPRQQITPTPYALYAPSAGTAKSALSATNFSGTVSGDVAGTQGATVVASVGGQTAASVASGVIAANAATSANTPNTLVARDGSGSFSAQTVTLNGVLNLPSPAIIYSGSNTVFIDSGSLYEGAGAGAADFARPLWPNPDLLNVGIGDGALNKDNLGMYNTAIGEQALQFNTTGSNNTAGGYQALRSNTTGSGNKADGSQALYSNTTGSNNTAIGYQALYSNTTGSNLTANGYQALYKNTSGYWNVANGYQALYNNTSGPRNTANGYQALYANTSGGYNTASGFWSLYYNTTGHHNVANGDDALAMNTIGFYNTADGVQALASNTEGAQNTANGVIALFHNTTGNNNTASGYNALYTNTTNSSNTADGAWALFNTTGINNIGVGFQAGQNLTTGNNNIDIGNPGVAGEGNTIRVGVQGTQANTYVAGIYGTSADTNWLGVYVDSSGHLGARATGVGGSGVTSVTGSQHITANPTTGDVVVGSDATPLDTFGAIVSRDGNGSFSAMNIALGSAVNSPSQTGILNLPTTTASGGMITLGGTPVLHAYGSGNSFVGGGAGNFTMTGTQNTANGGAALSANTIGSGNTASGTYALYNNSSGNYNTAVGDGALSGNTTGGDNTGIGLGALQSNTSGSYNTAEGMHALNNNNGSLNTANGFAALTDNTVGGYNTACGAYSLGSATSGARNIALGYQAGNAITTGDNNIDIGNPGVAGEAATIRIGVQGTQTDTFVAGIYGKTITEAQVYVNSSGQLGVGTSSRKFKQDIQSMAATSDELLALRPVTFKYKPGIDPQGIQRFGLVAEEVEQVDPNLVVHDEQHGIYTVRYEAVNAMLLNEFLKQHRKLEKQNGEIAIQNAEIGALKEKAAKVDSLEKRLGELEQLMQSLKATK